MWRTPASTHTHLLRHLKSTCQSRNCATRQNANFVAVVPLDRQNGTLLDSHMFPLLEILAKSAAQQLGKLMRRHEEIQLVHCQAASIASRRSSGNQVRRAMVPIRVMPIVPIRIMKSCSHLFHVWSRLFKYHTNAVATFDSHATAFLLVCSCAESSGFCLLPTQSKHVGNDGA